ncbi:endonuclease domain-containing protein [Streptomyces griseosporeus]|uniref:endonuclease domain-containing protein n=1 Tax=Streptomyces griseosporeus TaxID=1910 RepID=UPI0036F6EFE6
MFDLIVDRLAGVVLRPLVREVRADERTVQDPLCTAPEGTSPGAHRAKPERVRLRHYNVTKHFVDLLLQFQKGRCAVCRAAQTGGRTMDIDHDHACCPGRRSCGDRTWPTRPPSGSPIAWRRPVAKGSQLPAAQSRRAVFVSNLATFLSSGSSVYWWKSHLALILG